MKLTDKHFEFLTKRGNKSEDFPQIQEAINKTTYELEDLQTGKAEKISAKKAMEILGEEQFVSGVARSSFHYTSVRESPCRKYVVYFDSRKLFK